ncbi:MAG: hypothetical protein IJP09_01610 [Clostridia bacterium]|nr:hypothetical protein [Clostridia bacterium]
MIKGFCKEAVIVKCGGELIEEAIFILKKDSRKATKSEILDEANAIIQEKTSLSAKKNSKRGKAGNKFKT